MGLLGVNAWLVSYLLPTLHVGAGDAWMVLGASAPLMVLAAGVALLGPRPGWARWVLLALYPPALGAVIAVRRELGAHEAYDETTSLLAVAAWLAYATAAAHASTRDRRVKPASPHPLVGKQPVREPPARRWLRRGLLATAATGGFAVAVLAPALGARRARTEAWGEAADDGAVLTSVVAAVVAAAALGAIVGPGLRAARAPRSARARSRRRLALASLVAVASGIAWLLLRHFDRALGAAG
ncbi:MAG TPA: hypothetical protein RMH99_16280 [Sandaracinaceae bacterium LLY-WYZ-13_1]|nr:hypothetical protein [Sandaracinaceae bacterium LLY-WYZ-13_1]